MARPYIEFLQSQNIEWARWNVASPDSKLLDLHIKVLSRDDESGALSCLIRYPENWSTDLPYLQLADEEVFVLEGAISVNGVDYEKHHYAYLPARYRRRQSSSTHGAVVLTFFSRTPECLSPMPTDELGIQPNSVASLDTTSLPWDNTNMDPNISHLHAYRKNLRKGPNNSGRSYLLAGLPQGFPRSGSEPLERHPHVEEMFMIYGDMPCNLGIMRPGAYFWRPANIWHGADCTRSGFMLFMRTPGTNETISEWAPDPFPVTFCPQHSPRTPANLAYAASPIPDWVVY